LYLPGPDRIKVNVTYQLQQVYIPVTDDQFVAILKERPRSAITQIEREATDSGLSEHERENVNLSTTSPSTAQH
jgi:hypothetical protein